MARAARGLKPGARAARNAALRTVVAGWCVVATVAASATPSAAWPRPDVDDLYVVRDLAVGATPAADGRAAPHVDVYSRWQGGDRPVVVWIHGGGWSRGSKDSVGFLPELLIARGFVFVSVGYRLIPDADWFGQASDVAAALAWVERNIAAFGGNGGDVHLLGYSAGAHLAALAALDPNYLAAQGLRRSNVASVTLLDGFGYDVDAEASLSRPATAAMYGGVFGSRRAKRYRASVVAAAQVGVWPAEFLVFALASDRDSIVRSRLLVPVLGRVGVRVHTRRVRSGAHRDLPAILASASEPSSLEYLEFLDLQTTTLR